MYTFSFLGCLQTGGCQSLSISASVEVAVAAEVAVAVAVAAEVLEQSLPHGSHVFFFRVVPEEGDNASRPQQTSNVHQMLV